MLIRHQPSSGPALSLEFLKCGQRLNPWESLMNKVLCFVHIDKLGYAPSEALSHRPRVHVIVMPGHARSPNNM